MPFITPARADHLMRWVMLAIAQFVVLTLLAMLFYAGGNQLDAAAPGYSFTRNFFSSLGLTVAYGQPNTLSASLFFIAMTGAGLGLIAFALGFPACVSSTPLSKWAAWLGSAVAILSGACFIGVALTPANLDRPRHLFFVYWAFQLFPAAVLFYVTAILLDKNYPNRHALLFAVFGAALVGYVWLINAGPNIDTLKGLMIQAVGQKIIAYFSLITVFHQARIARTMLPPQKEP